MQYALISFLPHNAQLIINVEHVKSKSGITINGISKATIQVPDLRPLINMDSQTLTNAENSTAQAKSDKKGDIFLLFITQVPKTISDMEQAVHDGLGNVSRNINANSETAISTYSLNEGYYYAYAVDTDGRISGKSSNSVFIENVLTINSSKTFEPHMFCKNGRVHINFNETEVEQAVLQLYDIQGKLLYTQVLFANNTAIKIAMQPSIFLAQLNYNNKQIIKKLYYTE